MSSTYGEGETRRRILQAAWSLLETRGAGLTLSGVAEEAGVSRQAIYLHFGDRRGLMMRLVEHVDASYGLDDLIARVHAAGSGTQALAYLVEVLDEAAPVIDAVAQMLESAQYDDAALAAAWRSRMSGRQALTRAVMERLAAEGRLARGWSVDAATELCYTVTMPGPWRELTRELSWSRAEYVSRITRLLTDTFVATPARGGRADR